MNSISGVSSGNSHWISQLSKDDRRNIKQDPEYQAASRGVAEGRLAIANAKSPLEKKAAERQLKEAKETMRAVTEKHGISLEAEPRSRRPRDTRNSDARVEQRQQKLNKLLAKHIKINGSHNQVGNGGTQLNGKTGLTVQQLQILQADRPDLSASDRASSFNGVDVRGDQTQVGHDTVQFNGALSSPSLYESDADEADVDVNINGNQNQVGNGGIQSNGAPGLTPEQLRALLGRKTNPFVPDSKNDATIRANGHQNQIGHKGLQINSHPSFTPGVQPALVPPPVTGNAPGLVPLGTGTIMVTQETFESMRGPVGRDGVNGQNGRDGTTGPKGEQGPKGDTGVPGKDGANGKDGAKGLIGIPGNDGLPGQRGPAGERGPVGRDGVNGQNGRDGTTGPKGEQGPKGDTGVPGKDGANGKDGAKGLIGIPGNDGLPGQRGPAGERGPQGLPGKDGVNGKDGAPGQNGRDGITGPKGDAGIPGPAGQPGLPGRDAVLPTHFVVAPAPPCPEELAS